MRAIDLFILSLIPTIDTQVTIVVDKNITRCLWRQFNSLGGHVFRNGLIRFRPLISLGRSRFGLLATLAISLKGHLIKTQIYIRLFEIVI